VDKVLITGVTGFTGRYLAPKLAAAGYEVHGTVHDEDVTDVAGVSQLHAVDIADLEALQSVVSGIAPRKVVHLAAISFVAHSDASEMYSTNILGTRNLLAALASGETSPEAVVVASSANVYGNSSAGVLDESTQVAPANDYGVTKAASELVASVYADRLPIIVVRPFNYTGRGQSQNFLISKIVAHVRARAAEIELGNLDVARDFSDVRGVVDAYARLLETSAAIGGTYNVCSGRAVSLRQLIALAGRISGQELEMRVNPAFVRPNEVKSLCGSATKTEAMIGPLDMPPLEETLRWMIED
jgi:nucleoside-diphosphate-sugar epimerase